MKILVFCIVLVGISVLLLGVRIFFVKGGKFPNTHIHGNKAMHKRGISCVTSEVKKINKKRNR